MKAPSDLRQRLVDSLRRDGVGVTRFEELFPAQSLSSLLEDAAPFVAQVEAKAGADRDAPKRKDEYILRRFDPPKKKGRSRVDAPRPTLSLESPLLRVGASDALLDVVNAYREQWTKLYYADQWVTLPFPRASERVASQRWHRDPEEAHVIKVFLYLSDVDEGTGPFEYVSGSAPGCRYGDFWPWGVEPQYPPPEELERAVDPSDILTFTGSAGTVIICDTSGFHRGGFARTKPRVLSAWTYVGPNAGPRRFLVESAGRANELSPQARFALA